MLAIMTALDEWRQYLLGASIQFGIWTDHQNLSYFKKPHELNRRQAWWITELQEYDFTLHHKPGKTNIKADILSRRADHKRGEKDNENVVLLKPELLRRMEVEIKASDNEFVKRIKEATRSSRRIDRVVEMMLVNKEKHWHKEDGLVTWQNGIYVLKDARLHEDIIWTHHDSQRAGHPGQYKTQELTTGNYWWPYIQSDVKRYVKGCETSQKSKAPKGKLHALLQPNTVPESPWEHISIDLIGKLPESNRFNAILVIVDRFTKYIIAIPTNMELSVFGTARMYSTAITSGVNLDFPRKVISDCGPQFAAQFMKDLHKLIGTESNLSTAFHPQTDGQTERINQDIEQYLQIFINSRQTDWSEWLSLATFSYNDHIHLATGYSPFYLNYGWHPYKGTNPRREYKSQSAKDFADHLRQAQEEVQSALHKAAETMKTF